MSSTTLIKKELSNVTIKGKHIKKNIIIAKKHALIIGW